jgi:hypothetical protein
MTEMFYASVVLNAGPFATEKAAQAWTERVERRETRGITGVAAELSVWPDDVQDGMP